MVWLWGVAAAQVPISGHVQAYFRSQVEVVTVDAQVLPASNEKSSRETEAGLLSGRPLDHLDRHDFEILEDGVPQEITYFSQDALPLSVIFLFDLTDTVRPVLKPLAAGALKALDHLKPEDEAAVMVYAASAKLVSGFTRDHKRVTAAIAAASRMKSGDAAFFNEGVYQAAAELGRSSPAGSRRVVIWLTDNVPNVPSDGMRNEHGQSVPAGQLHSEADAMRELDRTGSVVCSLLAKSGLSKFMEVMVSKNPMLAPARKKFPPGDVFHYADETGGVVVKANKEDISWRLAELIDLLRTRYSLGFRPSEERPPGTYCALKVRLTAEAARREGAVVVRARHGYYR